MVFEHWEGKSSWKAFYFFRWYMLRCIKSIIHVTLMMNVGSGSQNYLSCFLKLGVSYMLSKDKL